MILEYLLDDSAAAKEHSEQTGQRSHPSITTLVHIVVNEEGA